MNINVLAFGIAKDIFGSSSFKMDLNTGSTVATLRNELEQNYPRLKQLASFMIAVNNEYVTESEVIEQKDEIAIIPPVSGG